MRRVKKMFFPFLLFAACLLVVFGNALSQQSAEEIFERAFYYEDVQGDLQKAIELYEQALKQFPNNREIAAKAQLQIGMCYEKQGLQDAEKAFQKVVENYPDQADAVKQARKKLAALASIQALALKGEREIGIRKVLSGPGADLTGGISPDGKYFCFTDWTTGDLAVRELATGEKRKLTDNGPFTGSSALALFSRWSPDGRSIAYSWWDPDTGTPAGHFEMRVIGEEGGQPRILYEHKVEPVGGVFPLDWQPDGKRILAYFGREDLASYQLGSISVEDGSVQVIKSFKFPGDLPMSYAYSPDGRFIAYDRPSDLPPKDRDIFLLSADGTEEHCLMDHPAGDWVCDWTSDGKNLLFTSDRTGDVDLWIVRVEEGKSIGNPSLLKANIGALLPFSCAGQDQFFYAQGNMATDIYMAELDPDSGQFLAPPDKIVRLYEGQNSLPEYSPDGKSFVYISRRGFSTQTKFVLCIFSFENNESREIDTGLKMINRYSYPQWRPGGKAISLLGQDKEDQYGLFLYDLESHKLSMITPFTQGKIIYTHRWASDGQTIFLSRAGGDKKSSAIYAFDLKSGEEKALTSTEETPRFFDLSPDGRHLVFMDKSDTLTRNLGVVATSGGAPRLIYSFKMKVNGTALPAWSADGKSVFFSYMSDISENEFYMVKFSLESGQAKRIELNRVSFQYVSPHPDGRHIIFSTLRNDPSEIWVIENFLPKK